MSRNTPHTCSLGHNQNHLITQPVDITEKGRSSNEVTSITTISWYQHDCTIPIPFVEQCRVVISFVETHAYTISLLTLFSFVDMSRVISFVISPIVPFHSLLLIQAVLSLLSYYSYTIPFSIVKLVLSATLPSLLSYYSFCFYTVIAFTIVLILTARQLLFLTVLQFLLLLQFLLFDSYCFITVLISTTS